jgi:hypothetical protein
MSVPAPGGSTSSSGSSDIGALAAKIAAEFKQLALDQLNASGVIAPAAAEKDIAQKSAP